MRNAEEYEDLGLGHKPTSYFSQPSQNLDPNLFEGHHMRPEVRAWINQTVMGFLSEQYFLPNTWSHAWVAGSGVSYQWEAAREPADLDIMLGIDYVKFRHANPNFASHSDSDIASLLNEDMYLKLYPEINSVEFGDSTYEVTVYVNLGVSAESHGIMAINPYAAYDVTHDEWSVPPNPNPMVRVHPSWHVVVETDRQRTESIVRAYEDALNQVRGAQNSAHRVNAERMFDRVLDTASSLYDEIHAGRRVAFSPVGGGYSDFNNYRWQSGKSSGVVQVLKRLRDYYKADKEREDFETYGLVMPTPDTIIRRSVSSYGASRY